jgi:hypothetical protein
MCLACFFVMISFQSIDQIVWNVCFTQTQKLLQHIELRAMGGSRSLALSLHVDMAMICHLLKLSNNALTQVGQAAEHNIISCISHIPWAGLVFVLMLYFVLLYAVQAFNMVPVFAMLHSLWYQSCGSCLQYLCGYSIV